MSLRHDAALLRVTPFATSEHCSELIGCPISRSLTACCVCLELRSLPSTGITRLQRYCERLRHPGAPGLSLAGVRLAIPGHASGLPVLRITLSLVCMPPPLPRCSGRGISSLKITPPYQPSPVPLPGRPAHCPFRGLLSVHSRCGLHTCTVTYTWPLSEGFRHFVTSMPAPVAPGWSECRAGIAPAGEAPPFHGARGKPTLVTVSGPTGGSFAERTEGAP